MISLRHRKSNEPGYTIVEVMIVLVISSTLFISAVTGYSQQNGRKQFTQGILELELTLQDILNDVGTGYYPNSGNFTCSISGARPSIVPGASEQGTNHDCIFVGRAVNLTSAFTDPTYEIYTIVGLRNKLAAPEESVDSLNTSANVAINNVGIAGAIESKTLTGGINLKKVLIGDGSTNTQSPGGFAVVSGFGGTAVSGSGATTNQVSITSIDNTNYTASGSTSQVVTDANLANNIITLCIEEAGGGANARHATITIGKGSSLLDVETKIDDWPPGCV